MKCSHLFCLFLDIFDWFGGRIKKNFPHDDMSTLNLGVNFCLNKKNDEICQFTEYRNFTKELMETKEKCKSQEKNEKTMCEKYKGSHSDMRFEILTF